MEKLEQLQQWIDESKYIVFFGGAGVSTESGVPDFRSVDGLYNQKYSEPPETILSHTYFMRRPEGFFRFYRDKMLPLQARPNDAHKKLAELEQAGKLKAVVTQNIDGLHQKAGSKEVLELHGSVLRNYCESCGKFYGVEAVAESDGVPRCACGGIIKPDVVLYECLSSAAHLWWSIRRRDWSTIIRAISWCLSISSPRPMTDTPTSLSTKRSGRFFGRFGCDTCKG